VNNVKDIKKLRNNTYLITVVRSGKEYTHILTEDTIITFQLFEPKELSDEEYNKIVKQNDDSVLYQKALHFIDYQMRSISETKKHLRQSTKDEKQIDTIIQKLKKQGYLNDNHFVKEYITEKINFDTMGPLLIKEKLIQKGIHYDIIDAHLIEYVKDLQFDKIRSIIDNETKYPIKKPFKKAYLAIKTKLVNRGFALDVIESAMLNFLDIIRESCLEEELLVKEIDQYQKEFDFDQYLERDKVIKKLIQKGFDYELIKKHM